MHVFEGKSQNTLNTLYIFGAGSSLNYMKPQCFKKIANYCQYQHCKNIINRQLFKRHKKMGIPWIANAFWKAVKSGSASRSCAKETVDIGEPLSDNDLEPTLDLGGECL